MKRKCDYCDTDATHHEVQIIHGQKIEKHLCDEHAIEFGVEGAINQTPINDLLSHFIKQHTGEVTVTEALSCDHCGMTFADFREDSLLGCPKCYDAFEELLLPLIERAHEGATRHLGKVPKRSGNAQRREVDLLRMRKALTDAVVTEDFEEAVRLRDQIKTYENKELGDE